MVEFLQRAWSDVIRNPSKNLSLKILDELYSGVIDDEHAFFWLGNDKDIILTLNNKGLIEFSDENDKILKSIVVDKNKQKSEIEDFFT